MGKHGQTIWDFRVEVELIDNSEGRYATRVTTASGRVFERFGFNALWNLLRILGANFMEPRTVADDD